MMTKQVVRRSIMQDILWQNTAARIAAFFE
jgi:hypothetical protein